MIESVAEKLAVRIKQANEEETASVAVMKFALIYVINFVIPLFIACMIGLATESWAETVFSICVYIPLRMMSGGYHLTAPVPCMLLTTAVMSVPPHIALSNNWTLILTVISLVIFALLAPVNMRGYNTMPEKYYPLLKAVAVLIIASNFLILSPTASLVFAIQGSSLFFRNKEVNKP
ncbi:accessory gene regulator ArgB-like protein [Cohnella sp.]|uniref:accessory gene regulator ArgB-like protein n=1 Tax=Cohnella sp. TaxID=1883426 RepID=UPI003561935C